MKGISGKAEVCVSQCRKRAAGVVDPGDCMRVTGRYSHKANRPAPQIVRSRPTKSQF